MGGCRNSILGVFGLFLAKTFAKSSRFSESRLDTRPLFCFLGPDFFSGLLLDPREPVAPWTTRARPSQLVADALPAWDRPTDRLTG